MNDNPNAEINSRFDISLVILAMGITDQTNLEKCRHLCQLTSQGVLFIMETHDIREEMIIDEKERRTNKI